MNGKRLSALLMLLWAAAWAGGSLYGAVALPNANVFRVQGPDTTGLLGFPMAVVPATGSAAFPVDATGGPILSLQDTLSNPGVAIPETAAFGMTWDPVATKWNRSTGSLPTMLAGEDLPNNIMRVGGKGGGWCVNHNPGTGTQATISQASGGGSVKNVCTAISFGYTTNTSAPTNTIITFNLRNGASGAGTVLMSWSFDVPATLGATQTVSLGGLWIEGSAATAMTLEAAAGLANCLEFVSMSGVTLP